MKRCLLWLCVVFLLAGHIPVVSAYAACEGRFCQPDHRYLLELYFSAVAGKHKK